MGAQQGSGRFARFWAALYSPGRRRRLKAGYQSFLSPPAQQGESHPEYAEKRPVSVTGQSVVPQMVERRDQDILTYSVEQRPTTPLVHKAIDEAIGSEDSRPSSLEDYDTSQVPMRILSPGQEPEIFEACKFAWIQFDTGTYGVSLVYEDVLRDLEIDPYLYQSSLTVTGIGGSSTPIGQIPILWFDPREEPQEGTPQVYVTIFLVLGREDGSHELPFDFLLCKADMRQIKKAFNSRRQKFPALAAVQLEKEVEKALAAPDH